MKDGTIMSMANIFISGASVLCIPGMASSLCRL